MRSEIIQLGLYLLLLLGRQALNESSMRNAASTPGLALPHDFIHNRLLPYFHVQYDLFLFLSIGPMLVVKKGLAHEG